MGSNTLIVWLHGKAVGPYMNGLHFFFGVGSFLAPIIIAQVITLPNGMQWAYWMLALLMLPAVLYVSRIPSPAMPETAQSAIAGVINWPVVGLIALFFFPLFRRRDRLWRLDLHLRFSHRHRNGQQRRLPHLDFLGVAHAGAPSGHSGGGAAAGARDFVDRPDR
ncbi:MAG: hypothetical protein M5U34_20330 [Chloroflexi bacterium]|nr:hypothetical protein [Chloroflexota bacterium]